MNLSTRTYYALKILVDLAMFEPGRPSKVAEIAERQGITKQFLHQILLTLKAQGMVRSIRGLHGGYLLLKPPDKISIASVIQTTQCEFFSRPQAGLHERGGLDLAIYEVWTAICSSLEKAMETVTIQDLCNRTSEKMKPVDYEI